MNHTPDPDDEDGDDGHGDDTPETSGKPAKAKRPQQVFTLVVEVGRSKGDGLPGARPARR